MFKKTIFLLSLSLVSFSTARCESIKYSVIISKKTGEEFTKLNAILNTIFSSNFCIIRFLRKTFSEKVVKISARGVLFFLCMRPFLFLLFALLDNTHLDNIHNDESLNELIKHLNKIKLLYSFIYWSKPHIIFERLRTFLPAVSIETLLHLNFGFFAVFFSNGKCSWDSEEDQKKLGLIGLSYLCSFIIDLGFTFSENRIYNKKNNRIQQFCWQLGCYFDLTREQIAAILYAVDYIPIHILKKEKFFEALCKENNLNTIEELENSPEINNKQRQGLREARLLKRKELGFFDSIDETIEFYKTNHNKISQEALKAVIRDSSYEQFVELFDIMIKKGPVYRISPIFEQNDCQKIYYTLEQLRNFGHYVYNPELLIPILNSKFLSDNEKIEFFISILNSKRDSDQLIKEFLYRGQNKNFILIFRILEEWIDQNDDNAGTVLCIGLINIFQLYVNKHNETLDEFIIKLIMKNKKSKYFNSKFIQENFLQDTGNTIIHLGILDHNQLEHIIKFLHIFLSDDDQEIERLRYEKIYKVLKIRKVNPVVLSCIASMAGLETNDGVVNDKAMTDLTNLLKKPNEDTVIKFFEDKDNRYKTIINKNFFWLTMHENIDSACIKRFIKETQKLLYKDKIFCENHLKSGFDVLQHASKYSTYENPAKLNGVWLRKIVKKYRHNLSNELYEKKILSAVLLERCFEHIVSNATEIDYSSVSKKHPKYNIFHEIVLIGNPTFFNLIFKSCNEKDKIKEILTKTEPATLQEKGEMSKALVSPINLLKKEIAQGQNLQSLCNCFDDAIPGIFKT